MLKNYLVIAWRQLRRGPTFTLINVVGLALGMAAFLLIALYVQDELSFDRFYDNADRLYRITQPEVTLTAAPLAPTLAEAFSGVQSYTRVLPTLGDVLIKAEGETRFYESRFYWADSNFFDLFSFSLQQGNPQNALTEVGSVVITERIAQKYYGDADPIGQQLIFDVGMEATLFVTGVMADPPHNSHFRPDFLASLATFESFGFVDLDEDWRHALFHAYLLLAPGQSAEALQKDLPYFLAQNAPGSRTDYQLQSVTDIHLRSSLEAELEPPGEMGYVITFSAIALLILLIACVNFMNLATARSAHRAREIGVRKILGAPRARLIRQFLGESVLLAFLALLLTIPLVYGLLPFFNTLTEKALSLEHITIWSLSLGLLGMTIMVGIVAGSYPAFFLSGFSPIRALRGHRSPDSAGPFVRKTLVVSQFAIGITLIISTLIIGDQLRFIQAKNLGFENEQTVVVSARMYGHAMTPLPFESIQQAFEAQPGVVQAAVTGDVPGTNPRTSPFLLEGMTELDGMTETTWNQFNVDYDFIETLGIELVAGRSFSREMPSDEDTAFLINEAALEAAQNLLGPDWENPVGKKLDRYLSVQTDWILARPGRAIGVVRDFHYQSLHHEIAPLVLQLNRRVRDQFIVRVRPDNLTTTLAGLESTWQQFVPERPFEYYFLDAEFEQLYQTDRRTATLFSAFAGLSLIIACLGLFGLAAFTTEQRTKEIGVRKVLGASLTNIVVLLSKGFAQLVLIGFVVALPLAYLAMDRWLQDFAYRVELSWTTFLMAGLVAIGTALLTVGYRAIKAAVANPATSLRYE